MNASVSSTKYKLAAPSQDAASNSDKSLVAFYSFLSCLIQTMS